MAGLTFPSEQRPPPFRRLRLVAIIAITLCVGSIIVLTLLVPTPPDTAIPLRAPSGVGR